MKRIMLFALAFAAGVALAQPPTADPKIAHVGNNPCDEAAGQVWTCTIQCDPGVRSTNDSIFPRVQQNSAGVEMCAVRQCSCQANWYGKPASARQGFLAQDTSSEIAVVVFGVDRLLGAGVR